MAVASKEELATYCLQSLGQPVIKINVSDGQVSDRIDDALEYFQERHYDGSEQVWVSRTIDADDASNGYITLPDDILTVVELGGADQGTVMGAEAKFSARYMYGASLFNPYSVFGGADLVDYYLLTTAYSEVSDILNPIPRFEHAKNSNRLYINSGELCEGNYIFFKCFRKIDPETHTKVYNNRWLKQYATQLIKKQWASNLGKHANIQLLGGITMNSSELYEQARADLELLEQQLKDEYTEPTDFFVM